MISKFTTRLRLWWKQVKMDDDEVYLSRSTSHADLERRLMTLYSNKKNRLILGDYP